MNREKESRYVRFAKIAYHLAKQVLPRYSHPKSPHRFELPQLAACVLLMFYLRLSYRDFEEWLLATEKVRDALGLRHVPDHTTLQRTYKKLRKSDLEKMKEQLLDQLQVEEEVIAADSTGFSPSQASWYYQSRRGGTYKQWLKGVYAVGTCSQLILSWRSARGPGSDAAHLAGLKRGCRRWGKRDAHGRRAWLMLADAGFDGVSVSALEVVVPVRRGGKVVSEARRARLEQVWLARVDGLYGQRWKCETVHSVIKRKLGDTIRSCRRVLQERECIVKALVYNIHR